MPPNAGEHVPIRSLPPAYDDHLSNQSTAQAPLPPPVPPPHMPSPHPDIPPPLTSCKLRPGAPSVIPPAPMHPHAHVECLNGQTITMVTSIQLSK